MKKFITLILFTSVLYCYSADNKAKNALTEQNLKGKVSFIEESNYWAVKKFGKVKKDQLNTIYTSKYDEKGNLIEHYYESDGSLKWKHTYKYDEIGNLIEDNGFNSDGNIPAKYSFKYDEKGNVIYEKD